MQHLTWKNYFSKEVDFEVKVQYIYTKRTIPFSSLPTDQCKKCFLFREHFLKKSFFFYLFSCRVAKQVKSLNIKRIPEMRH